MSSLSKTSMILSVNCNVPEKIFSLATIFPEILFIFFFHIYYLNQNKLILRSIQKVQHHF